MAGPRRGVFAIIVAALAVAVVLFALGRKNSPTGPGAEGGWSCVKPAKGEPICTKSSP